MTSPPRVAVFIDWQNCYRSARDAFGPGTDGNVNPVALATRLASRRTIPGQLVAVRIHSGMPSRAKDSQTHAARQRQHVAWLRLNPCVRVFERTLAYRPTPMEKGIDVAIAVDLIRAVLLDNTCDVAVLVSADTDLLPPLELIVDRKGAKVIEVAAWDGPFWAPSPLALAGHRITQHRLDEKFYRSIEDRTDYTQPSPKRRTR